MSALLLAVAVACVAAPEGSFRVGVLAPVSPRVAAETARLGLEVADVLPGGAVSASAASPTAKDGEMAADWATIRFESARAAAEGARGFFLRLPAAPAGSDLIEFPEEWQAPVRALRELQAMRPVIERGAAAELPFTLSTGVSARAWRHRGRLYVVLVNVSGDSTALAGEDLAPFRALFEARSDARQILERCGARFCLPAGRVLWLEGRPL